MNTLTPPVPESCVCEKPVTNDASDAKPPWFAPSVSATALTMPGILVKRGWKLPYGLESIPNGNVAPGNECPRMQLILGSFTSRRGLWGYTSVGCANKRVDVIENIKVRVSIFPFSVGKNRAETQKCGDFQEPPG